MKYVITVNFLKLLNVEICIFVGICLMWTVSSSAQILITENPW